MALKPPIHGRDHCPGGADPIPVDCLSSGGTAAALLHEPGFDSAGDENVAADTWELITDGANGRHFTEGWRSDSSWTVSSAADGNFQRSEFALYEAWACVNFGNAVEGDKIGVAIQFAASSSFFYPNVNVCEEDEARVTVAAHHWSTLTTPVRFWCYASVVRAITDCELFIRRFELNADGEILSF